MEELSFEEVARMLEGISVHNDRELNIQELEELARFIRARVIRAINERFEMKYLGLDLEEISFVGRLYYRTIQEITERTEKLLWECLYTVNRIISDANANEQIEFFKKVLLTVARALAKFKKWF